MENSFLSKKYKIVQVTPETEIDYTYRVEYDKPVVHGQFLQVSIPTVGECPISISDFGTGFIDLTIRHIGKVTNEIKKLKAGDYIHLRGPYGNGFSLDSYRNKQLIVSAGGTGLAPVKSIIKHFLNNPDEVNGLDVLIGFKTPKDILFKGEVDQWTKSQDMNVILTVDRNDSAWACNTGFITDFVSHVKVKDFDNVEVIIVGPPIMMSCTAREFIKLGIKEENIWVSFERNMSCGVGKCGHCKIDETYICLEGPVFRYTKAKTLID
ncbi:MAG TPA: anaerobic sulfite reductase subunit AsrB [Pseudobacteroides sp.]|uniref:anaerobic sulfite reductase subunit AsrB n=1 Tax=Pseudobacteroides sp. TaxID=1968840 RepID=UPI002F93B24E